MASVLFPRADPRPWNQKEPCPPSDRPAVVCLGQVRRAKDKSPLTCL